MDKENPAYPTWEYQDQSLLVWLQSSLSEAIMLKVVGCVHSQVCKKIYNHVHAKTKAKSRYLHTELRNTGKGERSIAEFLTRINTIIDSLLVTGETIFVQE